MRLLLASNGLATRGGSETYLITVARHLQRYGHEVYLVEGPGGSGGLAAEEGLLQVPDAASAPPPDRVIVQDAIVAGEVAAAWPKVPALFVAHSTIHDLQLTSAVPPTVSAYVALNGLSEARARAMATDRPVHRLRQPIDVGHFTPGPPPHDEPRQLLLFGNNKGWRHQSLVEACEARGIEVVRTGAIGQGRVRDPAVALRSADIVVGYGRCVLEAMACGRTALVHDRWGCDGWVNSATYPALEAAGFNGTAGLDEPGRDEFDAVLDAYDPSWGLVGHDLAFRHHHARTHARELIEILEGLDPPPADVDTSLAFSIGRVWREAWRWEGQAVAWMAEADRLRHIVDQLEGATADAESARARLADAEAALAAAEERRHAAEAEALELRASRRYRLGSAVARLLGRG